MLLDRTDLPFEVRQELEDPEYINRTHYTRSTYNIGCSGPLCRRKNREQMRIATARRATRRGRLYRPSTILREMYAPDVSDEILDEIIEAHLGERALLKVTQAPAAKKLAVKKEQVA